MTHSHRAPRRRRHLNRTAGRRLGAAGALSLTALSLGAVPVQAATPAAATASSGTASSGTTKTWDAEVTAAPGQTVEIEYGFDVVSWDVPLRFVMFRGGVSVPKGLTLTPGTTPVAGSKSSEGERSACMVSGVAFTCHWWGDHTAPDAGPGHDFVIRYQVDVPETAKDGDVYTSMPNDVDVLGWGRPPKGSTVKPRWDQPTATVRVKVREVPVVQPAALAGGALAVCGFFYLNRRASARRAD
ncbi:hypothetical protein [Streptomyces sp. SPB4]|uniref:hypothetical protein n=1 Tax=Streptomyces TaxID=1883 RepID=UPI0024755518|nr:hypothetical protein [Streptomyces sp. SPB4]MDH6544036.1 hypothetical protein [Streptomyces sp. SPB4]